MSGQAEPIVLAEVDWLARRAAHELRIDGWIGPHRARRGAAQPHPVLDFMFDYYSYRPSRLRRWHPGLDVVLTGPAADDYLRFAGYRRGVIGVQLDRALVDERRLTSAGWIRQLLVRSAARPGQFGCFGLHEWAMVYRVPSQQVRHAGQPLRYPPNQVAEIVEAQRLRCTHFDAYRFFSPPARGRNAVEPTRASQPELEQPGCLHANMDLYKWAYKLTPFVPSELVADAFALAHDIRELDMRASPYDLSGLGYPPVPIETAEGRTEYARMQRAFAARAVPIRPRLIAAADRVLGAGTEDGRLSQRVAGTG